jgi:hypothetical protein
VHINYLYIGKTQCLVVLVVIWNSYAHDWFGYQCVHTEEGLQEIFAQLASLFFIFIWTKLKFRKHVSLKFYSITCQITLLQYNTLLAPIQFSKLLHAPIRSWHNSTWNLWSSWYHIEYTN